MPLSLTSFLPGFLLLAPAVAVSVALLIREQRRIRLALFEQQSVLEGVFTGASSGLAMLDLEGRFLRVNRALCEIAGYPESEMLGKSYRDVAYADDMDEVNALFQRLVDGEVRSYQQQIRYVHRSGHLAWALISSTLIRDAQGNPSFCLAQVYEITHCKREAEALANRERRLSKAQVLAKLASWEWDLTTNVITWADAIFQALEVSPDVLEPGLEAYMTFVHPEDRALILDSLERAKQDHLPFSIEQRIVLRSGEQRTFHVLGEVEVGPQGDAVRMHGSLQDVTESRLTLDAVARTAEEYREVSEVLRWRNAEVERQIAERDRDLEARDQMFQRIVYHVPASVAYFDRNLACQWMSPEAQTSLGLTPEQVSQLSADAYPLFGDISTPMAVVLETGEPVHGTKALVMVRENGRERRTYWDYSLIPCRDPDGEPGGLLVFARDVSDRVEKEQAQEAQIQTLAASEALKDHFLNSLSHEIRSPLTVILGTAMLLNGEVLGPLSDKQRQYVAKLLRNGRELSRLVNNVIESNLLRSGRLHLHPEPVAMGDLLREVMSEFHAAIGLKRQHLVAEVEADLPVLVGDRRRLIHIWLNLVSNAVQYAPEGAIVTLRVRPEGDQLVCEVFNSGSRIPQDQVPDLFTAMEHPTRGQKGMGLGLGLCKALVEAHGGSLSVASGENGVTATFMLPVGAGVPEPV